MRPRLIPFVLTALALGGQAASAGCGTAAGKGCAKPKEAAKNAETKRFEPYDPDRLRAGSRSGSFELGNGTEVRVGVRIRAEYRYSR